jgi:hypothetical protein
VVNQRGRACKITGLGTHIKVADIKQSFRFYHSLGFKAVLAYGPTSFTRGMPGGVRRAHEKYRGVIFRVGGAELEIADGHVSIPDRHVFQSRVRGPKVSAMVKVQSLIPLYSNPLIGRGPRATSYYWGSVEATVKDPDGYVLVFIAPGSARELRALSGLTRVRKVDPPSAC